MSKTSIVQAILQHFEMKGTPLHLHEVAAALGMSAKVVSDGMTRLKAKGELVITEATARAETGRAVRLYRLKRTVAPQNIPDCSDRSFAWILMRSAQIGGPFGILIAQLEAQHVA